MIPYPAVCVKMPSDGTQQLPLEQEFIIPNAALLPAPGLEEAADTGLQRLNEAADRSDDPEIMAFVKTALDDPDRLALFRCLFGNSPFLAQIVIGDLPFVQDLFARGPRIAVDAILRDVAADATPDIAEDALMRMLRLSRKRLALAVAVADITGLWALEEITGTLSEFAEVALHAAIAHLLFQGHQSGTVVLPDPAHPERNSGFIVLAMGKLGAKELNYSSDIDLILLFEHEAISYTGRHSIQEFYVQLSRRLVRILEQRTTDGYVFRTDLRLRPDPGSTPPVISTLAAETYYESTGQNWERAAMIKARPVAGDIEAGDRFLSILRPFIWRRSLDFAAIEDIHSIKRQINAHKGGNNIKAAGHNVKLGRGGIREIEFFAQTQQLIWGGRDPTLRGRQTCDILRHLAETGHIEAETLADMVEAYKFLRTTEHRLQMIDDQQTHDVPAAEDRLEAFATFMGYDDVQSFSEALTARLHTVEGHYAALFEEAPDLSGPGTLVFTGGEDHPDTLRTLESLGFREVENISAVIRAWHHGRYRATRSARAREILTELMPTLLTAFSKTRDPDSAIINFNSFLKELPSGVQLFSLFYTNPALLDLLAEIMGSAPVIADTLRRHPILFDAVLTADFFDDPPSADQLGHEFRDTVRQSARDFQDVLDIVRRQTNDRQFQVGVHILRGRTRSEQAGKTLSNIADAALRTLYPAVEEEFVKRHGHMSGAGFAVLALGKLGGQEMTIASDLDLLFVYDADPGQSDGPKPLQQTLYFTRIGQRLLSAITAPTAEGILFEADMRLRPSGNAGPLACSLDSFRKYHRDDAWTWEHMALTRARVILASDDLRQNLENAIRDTLTSSRDAKKLRSDVAEMRERIAKDRPLTGNWDIKNMPGGLIDIEFIAQYLQLRHAHDCPGVLATNTTDALTRLRDEGYLEPGTAETLIAAMSLWRNAQGVLRLSVGDDFDEQDATEGIRVMLANACKAEDFDALKRMIADTARSCRSIWDQIIG
jgi:glutamate-ammonia-ligase adenylyltransferase